MKLKCDVLPSTSAFKFNLRRYVKSAEEALASAQDSFRLEVYTYPIHLKHNPTSHQPARKRTFCDTRADTNLNPPPATQLEEAASLDAEACELQNMVWPCLIVHLYLYTFASSSRGRGGRAHGG